MPPRGRRADGRDKIIRDNSARPARPGRIFFGRVFGFFKFHAVLMIASEFLNVVNSEKYEEKENGIDFFVKFCYNPAYNR